MPSIITHSVVGIAAASLYRSRHARFKFWFFSIICPVLPDLDVIAFAYGIPYEHFLGHRGFFHSISFSLILAVLIVFLFFRGEYSSFLQKLGLAVYFFILSASHGLLDTLTSGGLGIALLSPFDQTRYFFYFTPILVSPIGLNAFFSDWGIRVIKSELLWVWCPLLVVVILAKVMKVAGGSKQTPSTRSADMS